MKSKVEGGRAGGCEGVGGCDEGVAFGCGRDGKNIVPGHAA